MSKKIIVKDNYVNVIEIVLSAELTYFSVGKKSQKNINIKESNLFTVM